MKREDIIRMARDAGIEVHARKGEIRIGSAAITGCDSTEQVTRFAALVAAAEREACAEHYLAVMRKAVEEEREACAKLCEKQKSNWNYCAAAIRARGNT